MLISLAWLSRHVDLDGVDVDDLATRFTLSVAEIDRVIRYDDTARAVVGLVSGVEPIAGSSAKSCAVEIGGEVRSIVCGAPNVAVGMKVAVVLPGAKIGGEEVVARSVHGIASAGVLCSEHELGLGVDHEGLLVLPPDSVTGQPLSAFAAIKDVVFEVDNKSLTHRPDLWGHRGIAREVAALLGRALAPLDLDVPLGSSPPCEIRIEEPEACRAYCALAMRAVSANESPLWLRVLLHRVGARAINSIVDATNFVMLDLGNPVHSFDREKLRGGAISVRSARDGERLTTLDGIERSLSTADLVIADEAGPVALAGIMGGEHSGIDASTRDILLESANFDAAKIRMTAQRLALRTDASARFEKSLDPALAEAAARSFARLLIELCPGAEAYSALARAGSPPAEPKRITLDLGLVNRRLGIELDQATITRYLSALEFDVRSSGPGSLDVGVPSFRATKDITQPVDLIEELGRCHGYNNIPPKPPVVALRGPDPNRRKRFERATRVYLSQRAGFDEVLTYSFRSERFLAKLGLTPEARYTLKNAISADMVAMRSELATNLLQVLDANAQASEEIAIFEIGRVFARSKTAGELPHQPTHLGAVLAVPATKEDADAKLFFRLKGVLEGLIKAVERPALTIQQGKVDLPWIHPARNVRLEAQSQTIGYLGEVHPRILGKLDRPFHAALFELDLDSLRALPELDRQFQRPAEVPAVYRDFAFIVENGVTAERLRQALEGASSLVETVEFQSLYRGAGVPEGAKCLAWSVTLRHRERTMTDAEVQTVSEAILKAVASSTGGRLR